MTTEKLEVVVQCVITMEIWTLLQEYVTVNLNMGDLAAEKVYFYKVDHNSTIIRR